MKITRRSILAGFVGAAVADEMLEWPKRPFWERMLPRKAVPIDVRPPPLEVSLVNEDRSVRSPPEAVSILGVDPHGRLILEQIEWARGAIGPGEYVAWEIYRPDLTRDEPLAWFQLHNGVIRVTEQRESVVLQALTIELPPWGTGFSTAVMARELS